MSIALEEVEGLLALQDSPPEGRFEYINGTYVEKPSMGARANAISLALMARLWIFNTQHRLGICFTDNCTYRIFPDERKRTRIPDGSFVRSGRLVDDRAPEGDMTIPPDLAIEVISPTNTVIDMEERLDDLLGAGVRLIWVIVPTTKTAYAHRAEGSVSRLKADSELSGEDVVPGFTLRLSELFEAV